MTRLTSH